MGATWHIQLNNPCSAAVCYRVSTTPGNPGNLLEFKNPPGNVLEFNGPPGNFYVR